MCLACGRHCSQRGVVGRVDELRSSRHFFRNAYVLEFGPREGSDAGGRFGERRTVAVMAGLARFERELARAIQEMVNASQTD